MNKKGQAAMEFLMTYGWAIVVVLAAIGALAYFGVLSPNKLLPDRTTFSAPLPSVDNAIIDFGDGNTAYIVVPFRNNKGVAVNIPGTGTFTSEQCTGGVATFQNVTNTDGTDMLGVDIQNGDGFNIAWTCDPIAGAEIGSKFAADVSFDYQNSETSLVASHTGTIEGKWG